MDEPTGLERLLMLAQGDRHYDLFGIHDQIVSETMPLPRYEDGGVVQFGHSIVVVNPSGYVGGGKLEAIHFMEKPFMLLVVTGGNRNPRAIEYDPECDVIKRSGQVLFDADGELISVGDAVYLDDEQEACEVVALVGAGNLVMIEDTCGVDITACASRLHHKPLDTLKRIMEDARKTMEVYWGCECVEECYDCPVRVCGKRPYTHYGTNGSCNAAQKLDLVERTKEVCMRV